jgi:DNA-binding NarL/FixJ family response regulator
MKVFLAENSLPIRERLKTTIEEVGGTVVGEAASQDEAIIGLVLTEPQLAIVDLSLAEGSGLAVLRHLKRYQPRVVVVVLTDHSTERYQQVCMLSGADYFLEKAADFSVFAKLMETLQRVIGKTLEGIKREA